MINKWDVLNNLYVSHGLKIFPVISNGKTPLITLWNKDCSSDWRQIIYWMENAKNCNWGLPATPNNLFVIDLDVHDKDKNGILFFEKLCNDIDLCGEQFNTLIQITPSGGQHLIYKSDKDLSEIANTSNVFKDYPGIDFRTDGYIVVEPSIINGNKYEFFNNIAPQPMPQKLKDYILANAEKKGKDRKPYEKPTETVLTGDRDNQVFSYITDLYYKTRLDIDEISVLAHNFNETMLDEPLDDKVIDYKIRKIFQKDRTKCLFIKLPDEE